MDEKKLEELKALSLFQMLSFEELTDVAEIFYEKMYSAEKVIFAERDQGNTMYIVKSGSVKISKNEDGLEKELATLMDGDFFGEVALFEYVPRTATATATVDTELLEINRESFDKLFSRKPDVVGKLLYRMMEEMARRLRKQNTSSEGLFI